MTIKQQGGIFGRNPAFNDVEVENDLTVSGTGQVTGDFGVGKAPAYKLDAIDSSAVVAAISRDGSDGDALQIFNGTGYGTRCLGFGVDGTHGVINNQYGQIQLWASSAKIATVTSTGIAMENGKGIDFSATSGTGTSELFDDYEEGTWTPAIEIYGTPGTYTATTSGIYTKVGNLVTVSGRLINVTESVAGGADYFKITGLPFTDIAGYSAVGSVSLGNWNVPACYNAFVTFDSTGARDYVIMGLNVDNGATDYLDKTHLVSGTSDIEFTISYFT